MADFAYPIGYYVVLGHGLEVDAVRCLLAHEPHISAAFMHGCRHGVADAIAVPVINFIPPLGEFNFPLSIEECHIGNTLAGLRNRKTINLLKPVFFFFYSNY